MVASLASLKDCHKAEQLDLRLAESKDSTKDPRMENNWVDESVVEKVALSA